MSKLATGEAFSPQKRTACTSNMIFINFFLFLWVIFSWIRIPQPRSGYGSTHLMESGSNPDPKTGYKWVKILQKKRVLVPDLDPLAWESGSGSETLIGRHSGRNSDFLLFSFCTVM